MPHTTDFDSRLHYLERYAGSSNPEDPGKKRGVTEYERAPCYRRVARAKVDSSRCLELQFDLEFGGDQPSIGLNKLDEGVPIGRLERHRQGYTTHVRA